jgi:uncharacterized membrane protein YdjX (TVP38/TMEM64 family)
LTPLSHVVRPASIARWFESFERFPWAPAVVVAIYVLGGLVMLPVTGLSAATAMVFDPLVAVATSFVGTILSATLLYGLGARFARGRTRRTFGATMERVEHALNERGVLAIAAVRMVPLAPFSLVNVAAGALGVRFRDYLLGTALGQLPGILVLSVFGRQVRTFWRHPSVAGVLTIAGIAFAWIILSFGMQRWLSRHRAKPQDKSRVRSAGERTSSS